jgi:tRNA-specific adenosine deaminase 2
MASADVMADAAQAAQAQAVAAAGASSVEEAEQRHHLLVDEQAAAAAVASALTLDAAAAAAAAAVCTTAAAFRQQQRQREAVAAAAKAAAAAAHHHQHHDSNHHQCHCASTSGRGAEGSAVAVTATATTTAAAEAAAAAAATAPAATAAAIAAATAAARRSTTTSTRPRLPAQDIPIPYTNWTEHDVRYMREALVQARVALRRREVPVGAVVVRRRRLSPDSNAHDDSDPGVIVGRGFNLTNATRNATRHAEFQAVDEVLLASGGCPKRADFASCTLYVTCEPCIMCAGALALVGMGRVVFGCANDKFGGCGSILSVHRDGCGACGSEGYRGPGDSGGAREAEQQQHSEGEGPDVLGVPGHGFERRSGLLADEAIRLLQAFYTAGNPNAPKPHRMLKTLMEPEE